MSDKATLILNDKSYELPLVKGTENEIGIDINLRASRSDNLDPRFKNTGS